MALTIKLIKQSVFGDQRIAIADVTFDASYATGGEALSLPQIGIQRASFVQASPNGGYVPAYDYATGKILVYATGGEGDPLDEVAATADLSALTVRLLAVGV